MTHAIAGTHLRTIDRYTSKIEACERVLPLMLDLGPPVLRGIMLPDGIPQLLEGSHRTLAARELGWGVWVELLPMPESMSMRLVDMLQPPRVGDYVHSWSTIQDLLERPGALIEVDWRLLDVTAAHEVRRVA